VKPYRQDQPEEVWDLVRGCIRSYLILREKVEQFNTDPEIQSLLRSVRSDDEDVEDMSAERLKREGFDPDGLAKRKLGYQRLDQLTFELLAGVRG
jgi:xylose isomerase